MEALIKAGGMVVIVAVLGIFAFILWQILPLFHDAEVEEYRLVQLPKGEYAALGLDEWLELPFVADQRGNLMFIDLAGDRGVMHADLGLDQPRPISCVSYNPIHRELLLGTEDGYFTRVQINHVPRYADGQRTIGYEIKTEKFLPFAHPGHAVTQVGFGDAGRWKMAVGMQQVSGAAHVSAVILTQRRSLIGTGETTVHKTVDLTSMIDGTPKDLVVGATGDSIIVSTEEGELFFFLRVEDEITLRQRWKPFGDLPDHTIASAHFLLGDNSLVLTNHSGVNRVFSLFLPPGAAAREFGLTKEFPPLPGPATFYSRSLRNKAFVIGSGSLVSLRYSTTEEIRWEDTVDFEVATAALSSKYDCIALLDTDSVLHLLRVRDPHPEASFKTFFGKVWYEGQSEPMYKWESTGGSDDFEPKLSLVPLIVGSLKGTFYAMVFALPIALLAALYTSQFAHRRVRAVVKPIMEIMASLPSVVLGFLAALWLVPLLETHIPSLLLTLLLMPLAALAFGAIWLRLPLRVRLWLRPGSEIVLMAGMLLIVGVIGWKLGPVLERLVFVVHYTDTGERVADFRLWWPAVTGSDFEQRNSLVVGFMMGFAVIPIIFTIAEDSLSNVPGSLRSASLALGASRWQTAMRVVVPTASAGIFSAVMIGLGRAVGETMIVLMATGNTPVMDFNIFSGMRTLSANIAVELPEAPHHGTLYRTLFLGAMLLFLMTFAVNTLAELLRQHLRTKYRTA